MILFLLIGAFLLSWLVLVSLGFFAIVGFQDGVFWMLAAASIVSAVGVVLIQDVFKAALSENKKRS